MRRILVALVVVLSLAVPGLVPSFSVTMFSESSAGVTTAAPAGGAAFDVPLVGARVTISTGGEARAWNLIYELCQAGVPGMCELYQDGMGSWW